MTNLAQIRKALTTNQNITVIGERKRDRLPDSGEDCWPFTNPSVDQSVDFYAAPTPQGIYNANELQRLLKSLLPSHFKPTDITPFFAPERDLHFGYLRFDEVIGTWLVRHEITITDAELRQTPGYTGGTRVIENTIEIGRVIWVRLFPNHLIAKAVLEERAWDRQMEKSELGKYR